MRLCLLFAGALSLVAAVLAPKVTGPRILVAATVADDALDTMPAPLWTQLAHDYAGHGSLVFSGYAPATPADCRKAGADFLLAAGFELRPRLPGMPNAGGRVAARAHILLSNCISGNLILERFVDLTSDPIGKDDGPSVAWTVSVTEALKRYRLAVPAFHRVTIVNAPLAYIDFAAGSLLPGAVLLDYARRDHTARTPPIVLTAAVVHDRYVEAVFSTLSGAELPRVGDLVEIAPSPGATASPALRP